MPFNSNGNAVVDSDALAALVVPVGGVEPGTRVFNEDVGAYFNYTISDDSPVPDEKVAVNGVSGALWVKDATSTAVQSVTGLTVDNSDATNPVVNAASTVSIKLPCVALAASNITLSGAQTIDGVSVVAGDRVLVIGQSTASQNGIYVAASGAWTRAADFDAGSEVTAGTLVPVVGGTTFPGTLWRLTTTGAITIGSTSLAFGAAWYGTGYWFVQDPDTGITPGGANRLDVYCGNNLIALFNANGLTMANSAYNYALQGGVGGMFKDGGGATTAIRPSNGGNVAIGTTGSALATDATSGFIEIPTCAGTPTGAYTPSSGMAGLVVDTTNNKLYARYGGSWHDLTG